MNRLIIIGNGFDLAHGLKTSYKDFINWFWDYVRDELIICKDRIYKNPLMSISLKETVTDSNWMYLIYNSSFIYVDKFRKTKYPGNYVMELLQKAEDVDFEKSLFLERICTSIETKGWVDIENEYYRLLKNCFENPDNSGVPAEKLNNQLLFLQDKLIEYLMHISLESVHCKDYIFKQIYSPINPKDVSIQSRKQLADYVGNSIQDESLDYIREKLNQYGLQNQLLPRDMKNLKEMIDYEGVESMLPSLENRIYSPILLPDNILILSFNYTKTAEKYLKDSDSFSINYIHGRIEDNKSVIFGYGDELDEEYKKMQNKNENKYLKNIKSIRYLESDNYRKVLSFIESSPYQVCIMGHSCGNSDRTLLNTLFEHRNCISVKPYYYIKDDGTDNYLELVQNISRNFTDSKLFRDRVVNKTYCETL